eukprot:6001449-Pleurochrysis_carterae.AAC.1
MAAKMRTGAEEVTIEILTYLTTKLDEMDLKMCFITKALSSLQPPLTPKNKKTKGLDPATSNSKLQSASVRLAAQ